MRRWSAVVAVAASIVMFGTQVASASETVGWKSVSTNSNWHCGSYVSHRADPYIKFKACTVVNAVGGAQAVLVMQNSSSTILEHIDRGRVIFESQEGGDIWCAETDFAPGYTRGCYAPTVNMNCYPYYLDIPEVQLTIRGVIETAYGRGDVSAACIW